jgi:UDP-glucose 4-epimerase
MNVLVVGGAGYIGSHVARALLDKGHSVTVFDNLSTGSREALFDDEEFVQADILDTNAVADVFARGFDAFVHLAAFKAAGESMLAPEKYALNNINGTVNLLNAACAGGVQRLVFSSSAAVYGAPTYLPLDEAHPTNPENFYGFTKLEIERILDWYDRLKGLRYGALRYFNAAGYDTQGRVTALERKPANLLPVVMEVASGMRGSVQVFGTDYDTRDGSGIRDYVHVSDLADAHVTALEHLETGKDSFVVNLGSETGISVLEMIEKAREVTGKPIPASVVARRPGDCAELCASSRKARQLLGWEPTRSDITTLVRTTWDVYRRSPRA